MGETLACQWLFSFSWICIPFGPSSVSMYISSKANLHGKMFRRWLEDMEDLYPEQEQFSCIPYCLSGHYLLFIIRIISVYHLHHFALFLTVPPTQTGIIIFLHGLQIKIFLLQIIISGSFQIIKVKCELVIGNQKHEAAGSAREWKTFSNKAPKMSIRTWQNRKAQLQENTTIVQTTQMGKLKGLVL